MKSTNHSLDATGLRAISAAVFHTLHRAQGLPTCMFYPIVFSTGLEGQHGEKCSLCLPANPPQEVLLCYTLTSGPPVPMFPSSLPEFTSLDPGSLQLSRGPSHSSGS